MDETTLAALREEYAGKPLRAEDAHPDPIAQFGVWLDEAVAAKQSLANGVVLATVGAGGQPSARVVLLKGIDARGFAFYSNYDSRKGKELAANPAAALLFWWPELHRQVRVEGRVARMSAEESDAYFRTRPRASNVSAIASRQSEPIASRAALEARVEEVLAALGGGDPIRPPSWGGYRLSPHAIEFWQGRADRLHDRLRYRAAPPGSGWIIERLSP